MQNKMIITSESVGPGHPDKICDQIADAVLDECLKQDKEARVACEVFAHNRLIVIGGQITTKGYVDVVKVAWNVLKPLGYEENDFSIISNINKQSEDIASLVNKRGSKKLGAGDQGMVFGYATNITKEYMPLSIVLSHELLKQIEKLIKNGKLSYCKYDMKSQVSISYKGRKPHVEAVVISVQHIESVNLNKLRNDITSLVIIPTLRKYHLNTNCQLFINKNGKFVIGGPVGDTGLTGRKIIVDTYGSVAHHGGGAFSGKDPTKIDRTGAYFCRYLAKNIVAAGFADRCEVRLCYCIGEPKPISMYIDCFGTEKININKIYKAVEKTFDFDLYNIIKSLKLQSPIYHLTSVYGHFGKPGLSWEKTDKVQALRRAING
ncbi:MAG: methionine adenosyltransferase [Mycoplasma sp.]|nr:methionine adenosyltransferase [Candidatus Hennigella equi]